MDLLGHDFPFHPKALAGRRALICGASGGIGAATARMMAKAGAATVVAARSVDKLEALVTELGELGPGPHTAMALNLEDMDAVNAAVESLVRDGPVHILVNNAGGPPGGALIDADVNEFLAPFQRHLHASHTLVKGLVPSMEKAGYGRIIQIISTSVK
ncbi:MAG TPA: SDR family NAD(P)-dependent oxidoreductase, partial [Candidatus Poseidoniales archaeon]